MINETAQLNAELFLIGFWGLFLVILTFILSISLYMLLDSLSIAITNVTLRTHIFKVKVITQDDRIKRCEKNG